MSHVTGQPPGAAQMRCRHDLSGWARGLQSPLEQNKNIRRVTPRPAVCVWIIVAAPPFDLAGGGAASSVRDCGVQRLPCGGADDAIEDPISGLEWSSPLGCCRRGVTSKRVGRYGTIWIDTERMERVFKRGRSWQAASIK